MQRLKTTLKNSALRAARSAGVYSLAANSERRRGKLLILCYHGIALRDENIWAGHLFISVERFRQRLACLRDLNASVLPLGEAVARLQSASLPPRAVAITFDDGFYDFLHHAVPALNEFGFPATLYLTTHYSGLRFPIVNLAVDYIIWKSGVAEVAFPEQGIAEPVSVRNWLDRLSVAGKVSNALQNAGLSTAEKNDFARSLAQRLKVDYDDLVASRLLQIMTPEEAAKAARAGIDIQLHTHRHRTPRGQQLFEREIHDNRARIAEITGKEPVHFCYPSGVYASEFLPWLRGCDVVTATTCERGFAQRSSDPLLLPRLLDDSNMELVQFEAFVSGVLG